MVKKKTILRKGLPISKIVSKPYLVNKSTSKTVSVGKPTKMDLAAKPTLYPAELNPFRPALSEIMLNEDENMKLNEFLDRVFVAEDIEGVDKIVNQALGSGIRINAPNEDGCSFSNVTMLKLKTSDAFFKIQENIIRKLALSGADFDKSYIQDNKKTIEICNKVEKEVEPQVCNRLQKLREVAENAAIEGTVSNVEFDNKTFYMEFSQNSRIDIGKVINVARDLGLNKGNLNLGGNIVRLGDNEVEIKTEQNGKRNYIDVSDNGAFEVTFLTSLGNLSVIIYHNLENHHQVHVEVKDEKTWNELQKKGEIVGNGCLFGGMSVREAVEKGGFFRSGRWGSQQSSEVIKNTEPSETISWVDKVKETKPVIQSATTRTIH